eukprot:gnl/TRDRNA2_/TRDRNA2_89234_c0_seq1.p1 gnl/TRDRNA2_/TRDRNA2_89234_c0~~gnl/TRDRNA2_/TRDRNA2_89234_c0_seq1.p1  ORF type:complete len:145 (-),score=28.68 gnl/TRDRNA2_/TRDRNA2_89234_c0_seq1:242-676(-)
MAPTNGVFAIPDFDSFLGRCVCIDIFQLDSGKSDKVYATANDLGSADINWRSVKRKSTDPMSPEEARVFAAVMKQIDVNRDGKIAKDEIKAHFRKSYNAIMDHELDEILAIADKDGSGFIEEKEFGIICQKIFATSRRGSKQQS